MNGGIPLLIVDDDQVFAKSLAQHLGSQAFDVSIARSGSDGISHLEEAERRDHPFAIVISDMNMPGMGGSDLLEHIREHHPETVVLLVTGFGTIESAVRSIRSGAFDYLTKPIVDAELDLALERAVRQQQLLSENRRLRDDLSGGRGLSGVIGTDHRMAKAFELARTVADSSATLLVLGESGTGKSMIARSVHELSPRVEGPFVELHCGSIPETLLESELFGHTKGSFTGADADKQGKFLAADGGTIFIDEINSASPALQLKLLRVLQDRCLEPIGSSQTIHVDVRVILATNQPLEPLVREGQFREDLYYRINVVQIELPPLRDRTADIPQLVEHFLKRFSTEHGRQVTRLTDEAMEALLRYPYPGNVRELQNIMERAVVLSRRPTIELSDLPESLVHGKAPRLRLTTDDEPWEPTSLGEALKEPERMIILRALEANNWNRQQTAEDLQINRTTLYKKMKTLGLDRIAG